MLVRIIDWRNAGTDSQPHAGAVHERTIAPQQRCVLQARTQREWQWSGRISIQIDLDGMEPIDKAGRVVDCRVEGNCIRPTVRD